MSDRCTPKGCRQILSEKNAAGEAERYRRKGLDGTSKRILDFIRDGGIEGKTLLEVGGGIGAVEIELLKAGIARAVNVELTPTYEAAAGDLRVEARNGIPPIRSLGLVSKGRTALGVRRAGS